MSWRELVWIGLGLLILISVVPPPFDAAAGVVVGAVIGAGVSWYFSEQASKELRDETKKQRATTEHAIRMLQTVSGGHRAAAIPDEQGETKGVAHEVEITDSADATDSIQTKKSS